MQEQIANITDVGVAMMSLLVRIDRYMRQTGMPATKFGRLAVNDPRLVHDLRRGRQPGARMVARVEHFIARGMA